MSGAAMMQFEVLPVGPYQANCSLLWAHPEQAWVFDPGADGAFILERLDARGLKAGVIVLTHAHFDHVSALHEILRACPVPVYLHADDVDFAFSPLNAMPPYRPTARPATLVTDRRGGDELTFGGLSAKILHTPGHTPGGCCFYFEKDKLLVAGDTLFAGSVGRTDLPGGSWEQLEASLAQLKTLPDDTRVICGHGPMTTIGAEKRSNPYL